MNAGIDEVLDLVNVGLGRWVKGYGIAVRHFSHPTRITPLLLLLPLVSLTYLACSYKLFLCYVIIHIKLKAN